MKMVKGKRRRVQLPLLPGLFFAQTEAAILSSLLKEPHISSLISYYYDHFSIGSNGYNPPLVVPDAAMNSFMMALAADSNDVRVVKPEHVHYKSGRDLTDFDREPSGGASQITMQRYYF